LIRWAQNSCNQKAEPWALFLLAALACLPVEVAHSSLPDCEGQSAAEPYIAMKLIAEFLEKALQFEQMAHEATDPAFKASLVKQAGAYRTLAEERAVSLKVKLPPRDAQSN
jgi:hypothetical protein